MPFSLLTGSTQLNPSGASSRWGGVLSERSTMKVGIDPVSSEPSHESSIRGKAWQPTAPTCLIAMPTANGPSSDDRSVKLSPETVRGLMRKYGKTIRGLAKQMNLPMTRVRQVRSRGVSGAAFCQDWLEALTTSTESLPR